MRLIPMLLLALVLATAACSVRVDTHKDSNSYASEVIDTNSLNVRSCPSYDCGVIGSLYRGESVRVYDHNDGWAFIRSNHSNLEGWVGAQYLR